MASYREYSPGSEARHPCTCLEIDKSRCYYGRWNRDSPECYARSARLFRISSSLPLEIEFARAKRKEHLSRLDPRLNHEGSVHLRDRESLSKSYVPTYRSPLSLSRSSVERSTRHLFSRARRRDREKRAFRRLAEVRTGEMYTRRA